MVWVRRGAWGLIVLGAVLLFAGHRAALSAPSGQEDVLRILYVLVPMRWSSFAVLLLASATGLGLLVTRRQGWEALVIASAEVLVLCLSLCVFQHVVWNRVTWGVGWTGEPHLVAYVRALGGACLLLIGSALLPRSSRRFFTAWGSLVLLPDTVVTYYMADWWDSLYTCGGVGWVPELDVSLLRISGVGMLSLSLGLIGVRWGQERRRQVAVRYPVRHVTL